MPSAERRDLPELGQIGQVDEHLGRRGTRFHHVDERLSARQSTRAVVRSEEANRLFDASGAGVLDLSQQHAFDHIHTHWTAGMFSAVAAFDAVFVGSGVNSLTGAALLSRAGWKVCVLERNELLGGAIRTSDDLTAPGFTHELMASWHPLFAGSAAYAELGDDLRPPRARVPQHRPADRDALPGRRRGLPHDLARGQRRRVRAPRRGRRRRLEPPVRAVHGLRRAQLRRALGRALVAAGPRARAQGLPQLRPPRPARVRGQLADQRARLARDDVRVGARARPARAVGAAHRASGPSRRSPAS